MAAAEDACFFTYAVKDGSDVMRIGKGSVDEDLDGECTKDAVNDYLVGRYPEHDWGEWDRFTYWWHETEHAALEHETSKLRAYEDKHGDLPPWNEVAGGGGRRRT